MADLDPFLVHELLHGASLVVDLLEAAADGDVYDPVWLAAPEALCARDAALKACAGFYQAMGRVSVNTAAPPAPASTEGGGDA